jgi:spermidine synthase
MFVVRSILVALLAGAAGCGQQSPPVQPVPAAKPAPALPPGILARAQGSQGLIQVEERDGMRTLTIDGAVQAARPQGGVVNAVDPAVPLLRALRPDAKTALVIGLGSGKTASDLAAAGFEVEAVEIEQAVIEMAREHFGYTGHAAQGDGLEYAKTSRKKWDLILVDALVRDLPPAHLASDEGQQLLARRLNGRRGVVAIRLLGAPAIARTVRASLQLAVRSRHTHLYGSGIGDEPQNLILVGSREPLNLVGEGIGDIGLWPVPDQLAPWAVPRSTGKRRLTLVGYLISTREGVALDLPHWEMGAVRYQLSGAKSAELERLVASERSFPTSGDIGSDGDTSGTLRGLLGGGGVKRSDVRFSRLVAVVEGTARLIAVVHPDAAPRVPEELRKNAPTDDRLPYGGALYQLEVSEVHRVLGPAEWAPIARPLSRARRLALEEDLAGAAKALEEHNLALAAHFGTYADHIGAIRFGTELAARLEAEAASLAGRKPTRRARAVACDRARASTLEDSSMDDEPDHLEPLLLALVFCAVDNYGRAARRGDREAAARVLHFYETILVLEEASSRRAERIRRRHGIDLEPADKPLD